MKFLILNGPNLNMLGIREPQHYGTQSYQDLIALVERHATQRNVQLVCRQSNHEGVLVDEIQQALGVFDGIVLNPGAYTHTSVALLDALRAVRIPTVEVHISDVNTREPFRSVSYVRAACLTCICGHGLAGYTEAIDLLLQHLTGSAAGASCE